MRHRAFTDRNGLRWTVSEVTKEPPAFVANRERRAEARSESRRTAGVHASTTRPLDLPWLSFELQTRAVGCLAFRQTGTT